MCSASVFDGDSYSTYRDEVLLRSDVTRDVPDRCAGALFLKPRSQPKNFPSRICKSVAKSCGAGVQEFPRIARGTVALGAPGYKNFRGFRIKHSGRWIMGGRRVSSIPLHGMRMAVCAMEEWVTGRRIRAGVGGESSPNGIHGCLSSGKCCDS